MIGALALDGFRGFMTVDAATAADVFRAFVEQQLVAHLRAGDIVVMDNLSAHRDADAIAAIQACGADVLFLPPYSPEFNPIEKAWAKIKDALRRLTTRTRDAFDVAVATAMAAISPNDVRVPTRIDRQGTSAGDAGRGPPTKRGAQPTEGRRAPRKSWGRTAAGPARLDSRRSHAFESI